MQFDSVTEGRRNLKVLLDAAASGAPAALVRDGERFAVVDAARLRSSLAGSVRRPEVIAEAEGWTIVIPGTPIAADGATLSAATGDLVDALRQYAADWADHLSSVSNHVGNWDLVQLVVLSSDDELAEWIGVTEATD